MQTSSDHNGCHGKKCEGSCQNHPLSDEPGTPVMNGTIDGDEEQAELPVTTVWIRCDVYDTGIGIPGKYKKYEILLDILVGSVWEHFIYFHVFQFCDRKSFAHPF